MLIFRTKLRNESCTFDVSVAATPPRDPLDDSFWRPGGGLPICLLEAFRQDIGVLVEGEPRDLLTLFAFQLAAELREVFAPIYLNPWYTQKSVGRVALEIPAGYAPPVESQDSPPPREDLDENPGLDELIDIVQAGGAKRVVYPYVLPEFEDVYKRVKENRSKELRTLVVFDSIDGLADFYGLLADHHGAPGARLIHAVQGDLVVRKRASAIYILEKPGDRRFESLCDGRIVRFSIDDHRGRRRYLMTLDGFSGSGTGSGRRFSFQVKAGKIQVFDPDRIVRESLYTASMVAGRVCHECGEPLEWVHKRGVWRCPACGIERGPLDR